MNDKVEQAIILVKPLPNIVEALCADTLFYFKSIKELSTIERKNVLVQNISYVKNNLEQLEKLLD